MKATLSVATPDQKPDIWQIEKTKSEVIYRFVEGNRFGFHEIRVEIEADVATVVRSDGSTMTSDKMTIDEKGIVDMVIENFV